MAELTTEGYIERHKGKGTFVKKRTRLSREKSIGVILGFLDNYIFPNVLVGIERTLTKNGYGIDLGFGHNRVDNEAKFLRRIIESNVSGVIVEGVKSTFPNPNAHLYHKLLSEGVPVVLVHNYYSNVDCPAVVMDDKELTRQITQMVIDAGHRRIAGLFKFDDIQGPNRYSGFVQAMMENGVPVREEHIRWYDSTEMKESALRNRRLYEEFAEDVGKNCTAMVCYNDLVACAVITHLRESGCRVPEDISVAGFDDSDIMKQYNVSLTSVHHPKDKMGEMAAEVLLEYIRDPKKNVAEKVLRVIPAGITVRDSIRAIRDPLADPAATMG
jgi:GntR family transcriptional regulator of arabinose operon